MQRAIRKHIRRRAGGVALAVDIDALVAVNRGPAGRTTVRSQTTRRVVSAADPERHGEKPSQTEKEER